MVIERIRRAFSDAKQASADPDAVQESAPDRVNLPTWALIHMGREADLEPAVARHVQACAQSGYRCLVVSNHFAQSLLSSPDVIFEYAPTTLPHQIDTTSHDMMAYRLARLSQTVAFWAVVKCTWSGAYSEELRDAARQHVPEHSVLRAS